MKKITRVLIYSFITNTFLALIKIISGIIGASGALVADGMHSLSDTITDIFSIIGNKLSSKPADEKHPFGHGKIEYITCLVIGVVVALMGFSIIYKALTEEANVPSLFMAVIAIIVIFAKLILSSYILKKGKQYESNLLIASGKESLSDVISSVVVLIAIVISQLGKVNSIFMYADVVAMIIVGILILRISYNIFSENISGLIGEQITDKDYMSKIEDIISNYKEIKKIDSVVVLKYGNIYQITSEVSMDANIKLKKAHDILDVIESELKYYDNRIEHINIHINPYEKN